MPLNPYESPQVAQEPPPRQSVRRSQAIKDFRWVFVILLLPALYNYAAFDTRHVAGSILPEFFRTVNVLGFLVGGSLLWFLGVPLLEGIASTIRVCFAAGTDAHCWNDLLYVAIRRAVYLAIPGAALWAIWVFAFYQLQANFFTISYAVGIPAHLLGACCYLPLFFQWYRLARAAKRK